MTKQAWFAAAMSLVLVLAARGAGAVDVQQEETVSGGTATAAQDTSNAGKEEAADTTEVDIFKPSWESKMTGNDSELKLSSTARVQLEPGGGWIFTNRTNVQKRIFRLLDTYELTEELSASASKFEPDLYLFSFRIGENYTRKTLLGLARYGKDLVIDTESATFSFVLTRPVLGARSSQISINGDARRGLNDFKYDRTLSGGTGAFLRYGISDSLRVSGGAGTSRRRQASEIGSVIAFDGMPSRTDTLRAFVEYGVSKKKPFHLAYNWSDGIDRKVTPPRGNALEILDDPEAAREEEEHKIGQSIDMTSFFQPLSFVSVDLAFEHNNNEQKNRVDTRLNKKTEGTEITAKVLYEYAERGRMSFTIENAKSDVDLGPLSLGSYEEKDKKFGMGIAHRITDSLGVTLRGSVSLNQRFLKKREQNPRDLDVLYYAGSANMTAVPFSGVNTSVNFTFNRRETINIDRTLSADNRIDYLYQFVPVLRLKPAYWVTVNQNYTLKFESTEFVFDENNNTLDRTIGVETLAQFTIRWFITFAFRHEYQKRDTGSYRRRDGERRYGRTAENIDNDLDLRLTYRPNPEFAIRGGAKFQTQESSRLAKQGTQTVVVSSNTFESGEFRVGLDRKRNIGAGGVFDLKIDYVRRYGPNVTAERREYWIIDASLKFAF